MVLIKGSYYRTAIHVVPEMNNESYMGYYSSNSENSEVDSGSDLDIEEEEDNTAPRNDKNLPFCPLNERLQEQQIKRKRISCSKSLDNPDTVNEPIKSVSS